MCFCVLACSNSIIPATSAQTLDLASCQVPDLENLLEQARGNQTQLVKVLWESLDLDNITDSSKDHCLTDMTSRKSSPYKSARAACPW